MAHQPLDPHTVLLAYAQGAFPMARGSGTSDGQLDRHEVDWFTADPRAILPLDERFKVRRSLSRVVRSGRFTLTRDRAFAQVIAACANPRPGEPDSWINEPIIRVFCQLYEMGYAHSVETWVDRGSDRGMELAGGLYGVALGAAFFGESMFSNVTYGSQVALVHLIEHLRALHFQLLDVQFTNPHLSQFGVVEISAAEYLVRLRRALDQPSRW